ncbi:MAG: OstA-like protein [Bacteroidota bacterium]
MKFSFILFALLLNTIFSLYPFSAKSQKTEQIELIQAESMKYDKSIGENVRRLIDNVIFKHEDTEMFCDSAYLFSNENRLHAFSNIHIIVNDSVDIYGDTLYYSGNTRMAELHGNVKMVDKQMTLTTDHLFYDLETDVANYIEGGQIVDAENTLTSTYGYYYSELSDAFFKRDVVLINPDYIMNSDTLKYNTKSEIAYFFGPTTITSDDNLIFCKNGWYDTNNDISQFNKDAYILNKDHYMSGDSLYYDRNLAYGKAMKNVFIKDSVQNIIITGEYAEHYEKKGISEVTINPVLTVVEKNDSLFMHADTLRYVVDEEADNKMLFAYNQAKYFRKDLQGLSDSIVYNFSDSIIYMYDQPMLWTGPHQLTAEHIQVQTADEEIESIHLFDAAFIISEESVSMKEYNQVKGRKIDGFFRNNELYRMDVFGNGETIYYVREEDGSLTGINVALSNTMSIYIEDNTVARVTWREKPEADLFPPEELPDENRFLKNFVVHSEKRPKTKEDIFLWVE